MKLRVLFVGSVVLASACARQAPPPPPPQPLPLPQPRPAPQPLPPPPPAAQDWRDLPLSGGNWYYSSQGATTQALFGPANSEAAFILRCERSRRQVTLSRAGTARGNVMTIRTTSGGRNLPVSVQAEPLPYAMAALPATDRFLDDIAFTRGRFTVEVPGTSMLVLPAWPEPARVIEDCRS